MTHYPLLGMLPQILWNSWRIHDFLTESLKRHGGTGPEFREIFQEAFGDGIFTADSDTWKYNRSLLHSLFKQRSFQMFLEKTIQNKVETKLLPILDNNDHVMVVDLQDVFCRFTFDNICSIVMGHDPNCLSIDFPQVACEKAFNEAEESIFYRHIVPKCVWKLQKWLQIGQEKKMVEACETFDQFLYACIESKREELKIGRDTIASALTWFFWLVATNPLVEAKILEEMKDDNLVANNNKKGVLCMEEMKNLVYLHGAICEALRLFPPIPIERKQAIKADILPSGHRIDPNTVILFSLYAMGRSEEIWGKDCLEFKPERWISERGSIVYVPSYKFISFNAGPRTCLGKDLSFIQMKMVATSILLNYRVQLVEGHAPNPSLSIVLLMKHGLKVRMTKREI
ncbi:Cytochrome P450 [Sesbania bispinosa]|nr:Cytochrome P450 [Sesbania bispinosa]